MATSETTASVTHIADVQQRADTRNLTIDKVGIKDIRHPVRVKDRSGWEQHTVANFNMYVVLPHEFKGTHMSRFVEVLNNHEREISVQSFRLMLHEISSRLDSTKSHVEMNFPFFVEKQAPVSNVPSLIDYEVTLVREVDNSDSAVEMRIQGRVTSLWPCCKGNADYGAHDQR